MNHLYNYSVKHTLTLAKEFEGKQISDADWQRIFGKIDFDDINSVLPRVRELQEEGKTFIVKFLVLDRLGKEIHGGPFTDSSIEITIVPAYLVIIPGEKYSLDDEAELYIKYGLQKECE